jgi:hypothetical protein
MGIIPPYISKQLEAYYKRIGQTELLEKQRMSNANMRRLRAFYPGVQTKPSCPIDRFCLSAQKIAGCVKDKFFDFSRAVNEKMTYVASKAFGPMIFPVF